MFFLLEMVAIGGLTGILSGLLGVGGGFVMIPLLNAAGVLMREAVGLSLLYVAFTCASGTFRHFRLGTVDPLLAFVLISGATPMAPVGSHYATILPNSVLEIVFAVIAIGATAAYMGWGRYPQPVGDDLTGMSTPSHRWHITFRRRRVKNEDLCYRVNILCAFALGLCLGFVSGLLGVGGGWLLVPLLVLAMHIPLLIAVGTSLFAIMGPAVVGAASHWRLGNLDLRASTPLVLSGIMGAQLGALLVVRVPALWIERLLVFLLMVASAYMLGQGLGIF